MGKFETITINVNRIRVRSKITIIGIVLKRLNRCVHYNLICISYMNPFGILSDKAKRTKGPILKLICYENYITP